MSTHTTNIDANTAFQMAFQPTPADISVLVSAPASGRGGEGDRGFVNERRITPTWTLFQLKGKLETMTGVPPGSQRLRIKVPGRPDQWAEGDDRIVSEWGLVKGSEIEVGDFTSMWLGTRSVGCFLSDDGAAPMRGSPYTIGYNWERRRRRRRRRQQMLYSHGQSSQKYANQIHSGPRQPPSGNAPQPLRLVIC
jgi:hypothetical protein